MSQYVQLLLETAFNTKGKCGGDKNAHRVVVGKYYGKNHLEDLGRDGKIIIEWILKQLVVKVCTGFIWLRRGTSDKLLLTR